MRLFISFSMEFIHKEGIYVALWFEEAVFYHIYPIGMLGAPRENQQTEITHRLPELKKWLPISGVWGAAEFI